jgi:hypothetical protein
VAASSRTREDSACPGGISLTVDSLDELIERATTRGLHPFVLADDGRQLPVVVGERPSNRRVCVRDHDQNLWCFVEG